MTLINTLCLLDSIPDTFLQCYVLEIQTSSERKDGPGKIELVCREASKIAVKWCDVPGLIYLTEYSSLAGDILWTQANIVSNFF